MPTPIPTGHVCNPVILVRCQRMQVAVVAGCQSGCTSLMSHYVDCGFGKLILPPKASAVSDPCWAPTFTPAPSNTPKKEQQSTQAFLSQGLEEAHHDLQQTEADLHLPVRDLQRSAVLTRKVTLMEAANSVPT